MIIDAHTHMMHETSLKEFEKMGGDWAKRKVEQLSGRVKQKSALVDVRQRMGFLERTQVDMQIATPPHFMYSSHMPEDIETKLKVAQVINNGMVKLTEESKGKLIAVGTVPLESYDKFGRKELERAVKNGMKGVAIASHWYGRPLDSPEFTDFWAQVAEMDLPVVIHPTDPVVPTGRTYEAEFDLTHNFGWPFETILILSRLVFSGTLERFPTLKIVSHHLGGGIPFFWGRIEETYAPEKQEKLLGRKISKPLHDLFSLIYYDTAVGGSASAIKCAYDVFGAGQLVFATDAPFGPGTGEERLATYPEVVKSLGLTEKENEKIFSGNISKVFNL
jgi:aminocarboxymuconate-semialdehyde decarboxylase